MSRRYVQKLPSTSSAQPRELYRSGLTGDCRLFDRRRLNLTVWKPPIQAICRSTHERLLWRYDAARFNGDDGRKAAAQPGCKWPEIAGVSLESPRHIAFRCDRGAWCSLPPVEVTLRARRPWARVGQWAPARLVAAALGGPWPVRPGRGHLVVRKFPALPLVGRASTGPGEAPDDIKRRVLAALASQ